MSNRIILVVVLALAVSVLIAYETLVSPSIDFDVTAYQTQLADTISIRADNFERDGQHVLATAVQLRGKDNQPLHPLVAEININEVRLSNISPPGTWPLTANFVARDILLMKNGGWLTPHIPALTDVPLKPLIGAFHAEGKLTLSADGWRIQQLKLSRSTAWASAPLTIGQIDFVRQPLSPNFALRGQLSIQEMMINDQSTQLSTLIEQSDDGTQTVLSNTMLTVGDAPAMQAEKISLTLPLMQSAAPTALTHRVEWQQLHWPHHQWPTWLTQALGQNTTELVSDGSIESQLLTEANSLTLAATVVNAPLASWQISQQLDQVNWQALRDYDGLTPTSLINIFKGTQLGQGTYVLRNENLLNTLRQASPTPLTPEQWNAALSEQLVHLLADFNPLFVGSARQQVEQFLNNQRLLTLRITPPQPLDLGQLLLSALTNYSNLPSTLGITIQGE